MKILPQKLYFPSDETTITLIKEVIGKRGEVLGAKYIYSDGFFFRGTFLDLTKEEIEVLLRKDIVVSVG